MSKQLTTVAQDVLAVETRYEMSPVEFLRAIDEAARHLRQRLGVPEPGTVVWSHEDLDRRYEVIADGYGRHRAQEVDLDGDAVVRYQDCDDEDAAIEEAKAMAALDDEEDGDDD
jgi:hypothetical protein